MINVEEASHLIVKQIKPNFKSLGQRLGKDMKTVAGEITNMTSEQISTIEKEGKMTIAGYEIGLEDVEISTKDIPGWTVASEGKTTVALDLTITSMVFSLRKKENVKVRQPLQKVMIPVLDKKTEEQILAVSELIKHRWGQNGFYEDILLFVFTDRHGVIR